MSRKFISVLEKFVMISDALAMGSCSRCIQRWADASHGRRPHSEAPSHAEDIEQLGNTPRKIDISPTTPRLPIPPETMAPQHSDVINLDTLPPDLLTPAGDIIHGEGVPTPRFTAEKGRQPVDTVPVSSEVRRQARRKLISFIMWFCRMLVIAISLALFVLPSLLYVLSKK